MKKIYLILTILFAIGNYDISQQLCQNELEEIFVEHFYSIANYSHDLWSIPENDSDKVQGLIVNDLVGGFVGAGWFAAKHIYNGDYEMDSEALEEFATDVLVGAVGGSIGTGLIKFAKWASKW